MADTPSGKRFRVIKMVEARRLNPKSGVPLTEPPTPLPFGSMLEDVRLDRDVYKFSYLGRPFQCQESLLKPAIEPLAGAESTALMADESPLPIPEAAPLPAPAAAEPAAFQWQTLATSHGPLLRARVPGGWLLMTGRGAALVFFPDPQHAWNGETLPED